MSQQALTEFRRCIPMFQALVDPHRQDILLLLSRYPSLSVTDIARESVLSRPAISHHLKQLQQQGLVTVTPQGVERLYALSLQAAVAQLKQLTFLLERDCLPSSEPIAQEGDH